VAPDQTTPNENQHPSDSAISYPPGRHASRDARSTQTGRLLIPAVAAVLVGTALTLLGPFHYRCQATIRIKHQDAASYVANYRTKLLDFAWQRLSSPDHESESRLGWSVEIPAPDLLRLALIGSDRRSGVSHVRKIAEDFLDTVRGELQADRESPGEAEQALTEYVTSLRSRLDQARTEVESGITQVPDEDPRGDRNALLARWRRMATDFTDLRRQLAEANENVRRLESTRPPTHGIVSSMVRKEALQADLALQQDLDELKVQLTQLKLHVLNVRQEAEEHLDALTTAVDNAQRVRTDDSGAGDQGGTRLRVSRFTAEAQRFHKDLTAFAATWRDELASLRDIECDPESGAVLDIYKRVRSVLSNFLFLSAERLASMRTHTQTMARDLDDSARNHVLCSKVMRCFQEIQTAHHRFEFSAGAIEPSANFRLDSALRSSRGLRRRSLARTRNIETRLEAEARKQAAQKQIEQIEEARRLVDNTRDLAEQTIDQIVALQDQLNLSSDLTQDFLAKVLRAEHAESVADLAQQDLADVTARVQRLRSERLATTEAVEMEVVSFGAIGSPVNLAQRLRIGALAAAVTLLVAGLAQWWKRQRT